MISSFILGEKTVLKKIMLFFTLVIFCASGIASTALWHCIATNKNGAVWNWFGGARETTADKVEKQCEPFNNHQYCGLVCFPPKVYWRCMAHDTLPLATNEQNYPNGGQPKQGTWYWVSYSKQIALNGARDACRHNSAFGGCYADPSDCGSS